jgi:hypothetical protein
MSPCSGKVVKDMSFVRKTGRRETNPHRNSVEGDHRVCKGPWSIFLGGWGTRTTSVGTLVSENPQKKEKKPHYVRDWCFQHLSHCGMIPLWLDL